MCTKNECNALHSYYILENALGTVISKLIRAHEKGCFSKTCLLTPRHHNLTNYTLVIIFDAIELAVITYKPSLIYKTVAFASQSERNKMDRFLLLILKVFHSALTK